LNDITLCVAPVTLPIALSMLDDIRGKTILRGIRGQAAVDALAIAQVLVSLSELMTAEPRLSSIDINPAFAYPDGLLIVDARVTLDADDGTGRKASR
jgi:acetate---CoA ligase (ADP-forming)